MALGNEQRLKKRFAAQYFAFPSAHAPDTSERASWCQRQYLEDATNLNVMSGITLVGCDLFRHE
jgi:hypothetical protein